MRVWLALLALLAGLMCFASSATAAPLKYLPPDHPAYADLENLWTRGVLDSLNLSVRPWSRFEIASSLARARRQSRPGSADLVLRRMFREFALEMEWLDEDAPYRETPPRLTLEEPGTSLRVLTGVSLSASGEGIDDLGFDPGSMGFVECEVFAEPGFYATAELLARRMEPGRLVQDTLVKNANLLLHSEEGYFSIASRHFDVLLGYTKTRWGPGRSGTLMLSDAAPPYGVLRAERTIAGKLELNALSGVLSQPDGHYMAAHRATLRLTPNLSFGVSETVRYDSEAPGYLYAVNLIPYTIVHKIQAMDGENGGSIIIRNNVMMGADVNWRIRPGWRVYSELLVDDLASETATMPNRLAGQIGVHHARLMAGQPASLLFEFTKVLRYTYATFYDRDFILDDRPLGYAGGPDTERLCGAVSVDTGVDWSWSALLDIRRQGRGFLGESWSTDNEQKPWSTVDLAGPVQRITRGVIGVDWIPKDTVRAHLGLGWEWTRNDGNARGRHDDAPWLDASVFWRI